MQQHSFHTAVKFIKKTLATKRTDELQLTMYKQQLTKDENN